MSKKYKFTEEDTGNIVKMSRKQMIEKILQVDEENWYSIKNDWDNNWDKLVKYVNDLRAKVLKEIIAEYTFLNIYNKKSRKNYKTYK